MKKVVLLFLVSVLLFVVTKPGMLLAKATSEVTLSPVAQKALDKGLEAAKQKKWVEAIKAFDEARQAAPESASPLFNLGLAEAQIPGRELRAVCWFEAYLALEPKASNAPVVNKQIIKLEEQNKGNVQKLIELLKGPPDKFPEKKREDKASIASLLVRNRDLDAAKIIMEQSNDADSKDEILSSVVVSLARLGRIDEAAQMADLVKDKTFKSYVYFELANAQIEAGSLSKAKNSVDYLWSLENSENYFNDLNRLIEAEYKAGHLQKVDSLLKIEKEKIKNYANNNLRYMNDSDRLEIQYLKKRYKVGLAVVECKVNQHNAGEALLAEIRNSMWNLESFNFHPGSSFGGKYGKRMRLFEDLGLGFYEIGQREKAIDCLENAALDQIAGNSVKEICPYTISLDYIQIQEWDRAKAQASRETTDDYTKNNWSEKEKKDFIASREEEIEKAKNILAYAEAKNSAGKALTDYHDFPAQLANAWSGYINSTMKLPIFVDFKGTLGRLENRPPEVGDVYRDTTIFGLVKEQAEILLNEEKDISEFQAIGRKSLKSSHGNSSRKGE